MRGCPQERGIVLRRQSRIAFSAASIRFRTYTVDLNA
jgi:hypothetical protein